MKIIVLHGDDIGKSYERLKKFIETAKSRSWELSYIDESKISLQENLSLPTLFGNERFFILRDIHLLGKKESQWLRKKITELQGNLIIYNEGVLNKTFLNSLPKSTKIEEFKLPKIIWLFLETLRPGNSIKSINLLHTLLEREPSEFIFALMAKQIKNLYVVKLDSKGQSLPGWQVAKLKRQADRFSLEKLENIIEELAKIDFDSKTGKKDLVSALDLFIIKQLE